MLYSVRGKLILTTPNSAVVECGGVGFHCQTTFNTLRTLKQGSEVMLYTYLNVREDAMELFGFATKTELDTFKSLISVSGVGPKAGLAVLSDPAGLARLRGTRDDLLIPSACLNATVSGLISRRKAPGGPTRFRHMPRQG